MNSSPENQHFNLRTEREKCSKSWNICHVDFLILYLPNYTQPTRKLQPHHISEKKKNSRVKYKLFKNLELAIFQHLTKVGCHILTESTLFDLLNDIPISSSSLLVEMAMSWVCHFSVVTP